MQLYQALIHDLDGTSVAISSDGSDVSQHVKDAIRRAQEKGLKIAPATGRSWNLAKPVVDALGITHPCIIEGGTRIIDPKTEETLWEKHLDSEAVGVVFDIFRAESSNGIFLSHIEEIHAPLDTLAKPPRTAQIMYLLGIESDQAVKICNRVNEELSSTVAHLTRSWVGNHKMDVHVTHREATKQHAIQVWQEMEKVTKEKTIGMGDSGNDVPLFESVGFKVAVGNATVELKQLADYIAPDQKDNALLHVINRYFL